MRFSKHIIIIGKSIFLEARNILYPFELILYNLHNKFSLQQQKFLNTVNYYKATWVNAFYECQSWRVV